MTKIEFVCSDEKSVVLLRAARLFDEGKQLEPVRHARWEECNIQGYPHVYCSACKKEAIFRDVYNFYAKTTYCPHCGARMDGGGKHGAD